MWSPHGTLVVSFVRCFSERRVVTTGFSRGGYPAIVTAADTALLVKHAHNFALPRNTRKVSVRYVFSLSQHAISLPSFLQELSSASETGTGRGLRWATKTKYFSCCKHLLNNIATPIQQPLRLNFFNIPAPYHINQMPYPPRCPPLSDRSSRAEP